MFGHENVFTPPTRSETEACIECHSPIPPQTHPNGKRRRFCRESCCARWHQRSRRGVRTVESLWRLQQLAEGYRSVKERKTR